MVGTMLETTYLPPPAGAQLRTRSDGVSRRKSAHRPPCRLVAPRSVPAVQVAGSDCQRAWSECGRCPGTWIFPLSGWKRLSEVVIIDHPYQVDVAHPIRPTL